jgi:hypothetical protein
MGSAAAPAGLISRKPQDTAPHVTMPIVSPVMSTPAVPVRLATTHPAMPVYPASITAYPVSTGSTVVPASRPMSSPMGPAESSVAVSMEVSHHQEEFLPVILDAASAP